MTEIYPIFKVSKIRKKLVVIHKHNIVLHVYKAEGDII